MLFSAISHCLGSLRVLTMTAPDLPGHHKHRTPVLFELPGFTSRPQATYARNSASGCLQQRWIFQSFLRRLSHFTQQPTRFNFGSQPCDSTTSLRAVFPAIPVRSFRDSAVCVGAAWLAKRNPVQSDPRYCGHECCQHYGIFEMAVLVTMNEARREKDVRSARLESCVLPWP